MDRQRTWLSLLRCPRSGEPIHREAEELVSQSGKHRYALHAGRIPLFADELCSADARRQRDHYDQLASLYLQNLAYPHTEAYIDHMNDLFLRSLPQGPLGTVAEICCGQGEALSLLRDRVAVGLGADISVAMLEAAAANPSLERHAFVQGDATHLPLAERAFDHVFMFGGVHHVSDRDGLFREIFRILKPGGRFHWREPVSDFALWRGIRALIYRYSPHLDHETERPLLYEETAPPLRRAGFDLELWRSCGFLGFCLFMNSDVLVFNRLFRWVPAIRSITALAARLDELILKLPGMSRAGTQVIGSARRPIEPIDGGDERA